MSWNNKEEIKKNLFAGEKSCIYWKK